MKRQSFISTLVLAGALTIPAPAMAAQNAITAGEVAAAMNSVGMNTTADKVILMSDAVATTSAPALKVESMEVWGDHQLKVRLSCVKSDQCLPFFVTVRGSQAQAVSPLIADHSSAAIIRAKSDSTSFVLRAGARATLLLEGGHVHIQIAVICLENGSFGQTIRVTSLDHKQTYIAEVGGNNVLRGRL
jgi:hypothetical protein